MEENLQINSDFLYGSGGFQPQDVSAQAVQQSGNISFTSGGSAGFGFSATSGGGNVYTASVTVSNAGTARASLGLGSLAVLNLGAAVANSGVVAGAAYSQADFQAVIDKLNALLGSLRTAGIIAT